MTSGNRDLRDAIFGYYYNASLFYDVVCVTPVAALSNVVIKTNICALLHKTKHICALFHYTILSANVFKVKHLYLSCTLIRMLIIASFPRISRNFFFSCFVPRVDFDFTKYFLAVSFSVYLQYILTPTLCLMAFSHIHADKAAQASSCQHP